ncbi:hypothetical protein Ddc_10894 [Ditylenchus destructor]|nr:hypothetical protein Ddc_10894 [Ditylenchus destructor]
MCEGDKIRRKLGKRRMRRCVACGNSMDRGAVLPANPIRRQDFLDNLCLTKYSEFIANKCFICFDHFDPQDLITRNGVVVKLRHSQVVPIKRSSPFHNPRFEQKVNKLASERLAWSGISSKLLGEDSDDVDGIEDEQEPVESPQSSEMNLEIAGSSSQGLNLEPQTTSADNSNMNPDDNSNRDVQLVDESFDQQTLDSHVLNRNVCGARIRYNGGSDVPGKPSSCDIDPVSNTRFYEPHHSGPEEMFCLSQVTQIGEKICSIENKFSQLVDLVTEFVMAKANAIEEQNNTAALRHQQRMNYEYQMQRKQEMLKEQKRRERKARKTDERNKELEEKRQRKEEIKNSQPFLLYNGLKIYFPTSMRNDNRVCKVCYAKFDNKILLADHLMSETDLNDEHYRCFVCEQNVIYLSELAVQQHVMQAHPFEHEPRYGLFDDLNLRSKEVIRAYAEKMVGDNANVISLDSDSDGQPNEFFKDTAKRICLESDTRRHDVENVEDIEDITPADAEPADTATAAPLPDELPMESAAQESNAEQSSGI